MLDEFKEELVHTVKISTEVLNDDDALEIIGICKKAVDRKIADATEQYLMNCVNGGEEKQE